MRIALLDGSTYYWLAGNPALDVREHSPAADYEDAPEAASEIVQLVRADNAQEIDRGNLLHRISFSTTRRFATPAEAQLWCHDYDTAFPRSGTLLLDAIAPTGAITRRQMANARVAPPRKRVMGCTVMLNYSVSGGAISAWAGAAPGTLTITGTMTTDGSTPVPTPMTLPIAGQEGGKTYWNLPGSPAWRMAWDAVDNRWEFQPFLLSPPQWVSSSDTLTPDLATGWTTTGTNTGTPTIVLNP